LWTVDPESRARPVSLAQTWPIKGSAKLAISPGGEYIAIGGSREIRLWRTQDQTMLGPFPVQTAWVRALAFDAKGKRLAIAGEQPGEVVEIWDVESNRTIQSFPHLHGTVRTLIFSANGRYLFTGGDDLKARRWDLTAPGQPVELAGPPKQPPFNGGVYAMAFAIDNRTLLVGDASGRVSRYKDGTIYLDRFQAHNGPIQGIRVHPLGEAIYTVGESGELRAHSHRTKEFLSVPFRRAGHGMFGLAMSADGSVVASGADDGVLQLWRAHWTGNFELACSRLTSHPRFVRRADEQPALLPILEDVSQACSTQFWKSAAARQPYQLDYEKQ
jgi:WD40 repeat protein